MQLFSSIFRRVRLSTPPTAQYCFVPPLLSTFRINHPCCSRKNFITMSSTSTTNKQTFQPLSPKPDPPMHAPLISSKQAAMIDEKLMSPSIGYTLPILMELAGLSVAQAIHDYTSDNKQKHICFVCGPGNNGGDGLVAARHLIHFGYTNVSIICPKKPKKFDHLFNLLSVHNVPVYDNVDKLNTVHVWIDCIFGFSFNSNDGIIRQPYADLIQHINSTHGHGKHAHIISVDVPSAWDVDKGKIIHGCLSTPDVIISLTAPKKFMEFIEREDLKNDIVHYIGGRFVPKTICEEFDFQIPVYEGSSQIVRIS